MMWRKNLDSVIVIRELAFKGAEFFPKDFVSAHQVFPRECVRLTPAPCVIDVL